MKSSQYYYRLGLVACVTGLLFFTMTLYMYVTHNMTLSSQEKDVFFFMTYGSLTVSMGITIYCLFKGQRAENHRPLTLST